MKNIVITGGRGFLGCNLAAHLAVRNDCVARQLGREDSVEELESALRSADVVFHLAGINRPKHPREFEDGNNGFTQGLCDFLRTEHLTPKIVFSSSIQASLDNPYGVSKRRAEEALLAFSGETGAIVRIYRLKNLFGKWSLPNYNSVTATFCHNIANELPISISDPANVVELSYVDDVVSAFLTELHGEADPESIPAYRIRLDELAGRIQAFHDIGQMLLVPDFQNPFNRDLYATYLSYVPMQAREHKLHRRIDERGSLAEFLKTKHAGQIFVSRTFPGVTRGNHYHHTKGEQFLVVEGEAVIRMRPIDSDAICEYKVKGEDFQVVSIPPGLTHSITNTGKGEMITLFWASEIFDPDRPDTYFLPVDGPPIALLSKVAKEKVTMRTAGGGAK